jgi:hypothetical protein
VNLLGLRSHRPASADVILLQAAGADGLDAAWDRDVCRVVCMAVQQLAASLMHVVASCVQ